jgi:beta-aspartyl-dipeptidase (metallo-type)
MQTNSRPVLTLLRNVRCYCPAPAGVKDILIAGDRICKITRPGELHGSTLIERIGAGLGLAGFRGLGDQPVHTTGAGG